MSLISLQWSINSNFEDGRMFYNFMEQGKETELAHLFFLLTAALHNRSWKVKYFFSHKLSAAETAHLQSLLQYICVTCTAQIVC